MRESAHSSQSYIRDLNNTTEHSSVILEPGQESSYRSSAVVLTPGTFSDEPHVS